MFIRIFIGIRKTRKWFGCETFYYLFEFKVFWHEERETQFLSMLTFPIDPTTCGTSPQTTNLASASSENRLASSKPKSQLTVFFKFQNSPPIASGHDVIHIPVSFPIWGFYCDICDSHILPASAWTPALNACTELTLALSRKVLSQTKPKGKIYKTKNDNIKKILPQLYHNFQTFLLRCNTRLFEWDSQWSSNSLVMVC